MRGDEESTRVALEAGLACLQTRTSVSSPVKEIAGEDGSVQEREDEGAVVARRSPASVSPPPATAWWYRPQPPLTVLSSTPETATTNTNGTSTSTIATDEPRTSTTTSSLHAATPIPVVDDVTLAERTRSLEEDMIRLLHVAVLAGSQGRNPITQQTAARTLLGIAATTVWCPSTGRPRLAVTRAALQPMVPSPSSSPPSMRLRRSRPPSSSWLSSSSSTTSSSSSSSIFTTSPSSVQMEVPGTGKLDWYQVTWLDLIMAWLWDTPWTVPTMATKCNNSNSYTQGSNHGDNHHHHHHHHDGGHTPGPRHRRDLPFPPRDLEARRMVVNALSRFVVQEGRSARELEHRWLTGLLRLTAHEITRHGVAVGDPPLQTTTRRVSAPIDATDLATVKGATITTATTATTATTTVSNHNPGGASSRTWMAWGQGLVRMTQWSSYPSVVPLSSVRSWWGWIRGGGDVPVGEERGDQGGSKMIKIKSETEMETEVDTKKTKKETADVPLRHGITRPWWHVTTLFSTSPLRITHEADRAIPRHHDTRTHNSRYHITTPMVLAQREAEVAATNLERLAQLARNVPAAMGGTEPPPPDSQMVGPRTAQFLFPLEDDEELYGDSLSDLAAATAAGPQGPEMGAITRVLAALTGVLDGYADGPIRSNSSSPAPDLPVPDPPVNSTTSSCSSTPRSAVSVVPKWSEPSTWSALFRNPTAPTPPPPPSPARLLVIAGVLNLLQRLLPDESWLSPPGGTVGTPHQQLALGRTREMARLLAELTAFPDDHVHRAVRRSHLFSWLRRMTHEPDLEVASSATKALLHLTYPIATANPRDGDQLQGPGTDPSVAFPSSASPTSSSSTASSTLDPARVVSRVLRHAQDIADIDIDPMDSLTSIDVTQLSMSRFWRELEAVVLPADNPPRYRDGVHLFDPAHDMHHVLGARGRDCVDTKAGAPAYDVVFVHGLMGDAFRTWRRRDVRPGWGFGTYRLEPCMTWPGAWMRGDRRGRKDHDGTEDAAEEIPPHGRLLSYQYHAPLGYAWFTGGGGGGGGAGSAKAGSIHAGGSSGGASTRGGSGMGANSSSFPPLADLARTFLEHLREAGVGDRPVIFIAHSLGGLLVKQALLLADKEHEDHHHDHDHNHEGGSTAGETRVREESENPARQSPSSSLPSHSRTASFSGTTSSNHPNRINQNQIRSATRAVVFFGVPHFGAWTAQVAGRTAAPFIALGTGPSEAIRTLRPGEFLEQLNRAFASVVVKGHGVHVLSVLETQRTVVPVGPGSLAFHIVPMESAYPGYGKFVTVADNHLNVCKPERVDHPVYVALRDLMREAVGGGEARE